MKALKNVNRIPWKYVVGMNLTVLVLAFSFLSVSSLNKTTENRSQAKEAVPTPAPTYQYDSTNPPKLINPDIDWGKVGDAVVIKGENLGRIPFGTLSIGNVIIPMTNIIAWEPTQIVFTIPNNAVTAPITLTVKADTETLILKTERALTITTTNKID